MTVLFIMVGSLALLGAAGKLYSGFIARRLGEDSSRPTPATLINDGRDYVPSPTPVVFAHHFAAIAGAGPIIGPVIALVYGWVPALIWVLAGGILIGAVHDYLAVHMATREGGQSVATIARRTMGDGVFIAMVLFLIVMLALVCAAFLNLSARALVSMVPFDRVQLPADQTLFRVQDGQVVLGGVASMSVIVLTAFAPLVGWMYIKRKISVWKCSVAAVVICAVSITVGVYVPVWFPALHVPAFAPGGWRVWGAFTIESASTWKILLSIYVLVAAGLPVWLFLQSRDFINAHVLYAGMAFLLLTLVVAGARSAGASAPEGVEAIPALSIGSGGKALGFIWPFLFITVACGAVSGFHSLCAGGTTCKQITSEAAARRIGYFAMLLETFVAVAVIATMMIGADLKTYWADVHPMLLHGTDRSANEVQGFAMGVGWASYKAWGMNPAWGALAGMILLEGFLITTLDAAVRLTRYLIEELWRMLFGRYDVFAAPVGPHGPGGKMIAGEAIVAGGESIPTVPIDEQPPAPSSPVATGGVFRFFLRTLRHYWINSGIAVGLMLLLALTGGQSALWGIFATANQLLAAFVLSLAALWLLRKGRKLWFAAVPAVLMLNTTIASLVMLMFKYWRSYLHPARAGDEWKMVPLIVADAVILCLTTYLLYKGIRWLLKEQGARMRLGPTAVGVAATLGTSAVVVAGGVLAFTANMGMWQAPAWLAEILGF
ncbi:MAG: carbon starvation protein A [Phycisphaerae bacterium]